MRKRVVILGSTGSIGINSIDVIEKNNKDFQIIGLTAGKNVKLLAEQARKIKPVYLPGILMNKLKSSLLLLRRIILPSIRNN